MIINGTGFDISVHTTKDGSFLIKNAVKKFLNTGITTIFATLENFRRK